MCIICNGGTYDDLHLSFYLRIAQHGWTQMAVEGEPRIPDWAYSIGLCAYGGHPELAVVGPCYKRTNTVLTALAERIKAGERFVAGSSTALLDGEVRFVEVHEDLYEEVFAGWIMYFESLNRPMPVLQGLQVLIPDDWMCCKRPPCRQIRLDDPASLAVFERGLNREERRRRDRRHRRRPDRQR